MPKEVVQALEVILDCYWVDELHNFKATPEAEHEHHVFSSLLKVKRWMEDRPEWVPADHMFEDL